MLVQKAIGAISSIVYFSQNEKKTFVLITNNSVHLRKFRCFIDYQLLLLDKDELCSSVGLFEPILVSFKSHSVLDWMSTWTVKTGLELCLGFST